MFGAHWAAMSPINLEFGFIEADAGAVASKFCEWQQSIGSQWKTEAVHGESFCDALESLLPLTNCTSLREIFMPTMSRWTAYFSNLLPNADAQSRMSVLARLLGCQALRVVNVENKVGQPKARYGATILEVFGPGQEGKLNYVRSIAAANDGGRWVFEQSGEVQWFEEVEQYRERLVKNRFNREMLGRYLRALGIDSQDINFFRNNETLLLHRTDSPPRQLEYFTLEQARARYGG